MAEKELKNIVKHTQIYALGNIFNRGAGLILLPVYINTLTPSEYGVYAFVAIAMEIVSVLLVMGLGNTLVRFYVDCASDSERNKVVSTTFIFFGIISLLFLLITKPLAGLTCFLIFGDSAHQTLFMYGYCALVFTALFNIQLQYLLVRKKSWLYFITSTFKTILFLTLNILFVVVLKYGVMGIILGTLVSSAILTIVILFLIFKEVRIHFSTSLLKRMLIFGAPLVPAVLFDTILAALDKYYLNQHLNTGAVGKYALADKLTNLIKMFVVGPFFQIWIVRRLETLNQDTPESIQQFNSIFLLFISFVIWACLGVSLFSNEIIFLIAPEAYAHTALIIPIMALTQVFLAIRLNSEVSIFHSKQTKYMAYASGLTLLLAIPAYYFLIKEFGLIGGAGGLCIINIFRTILVSWFASKSSNTVLSGDWYKITLVIFLAVAFYSLCYFISGTTVSINAALLKFSLMVLFVLAVIFSPITSEKIRLEIILLFTKNKIARRFFTYNAEPNRTTKSINAALLKFSVMVLFVLLIFFSPITSDKFRLEVKSLFTNNKIAWHFSTSNAQPK
jgi:O-antigen/teichoic acid export membrane protein